MSRGAGDPGGATAPTPPPPEREGVGDLFGRFRLDGRVALVTGTSSSLGRRFAQVLDAAGAAVVLASRRTEPDAELAGALADPLAVQCDIRRGEDRETLVAAALERFGRIDVLVNNAGVTGSYPPEEEPLASTATSTATASRGM